MDLNQIKLFEGKGVRSIWDRDKEEWYFSVVDVIGVLTGSNNPRDYWYRVKKRMTEEEKSELSTICRQLKLESSDGKKYNTDVADIQGIFRIIQSIPSPKAEPFKVWLAKVGKERIDETIDPELAIERARSTYRKKGYDEKWIQQRMMTIRARNELTDEWKAHGVKQGWEYASLTDALTLEWAGMTTRDYKDLKNLKKENLRDNMSTLELALNMVAEATTTELTRAKNPQGYEENKKVAKEGGRIAGNTRKEIEAKTGRPVVTSKNAKDFQLESPRSLEIEGDE